MRIPDPRKTFWSIGLAADYFHVTVEEFDAAAEALNIEPHFWLDGVAKYGAVECAAIGDEIKHRREAKEPKADAQPAPTPPTQPLVN